ncbi:YqaE/Pmp3 family membrane protein [Chitinophagaceae bacterium IBVUCB1]|nr:YqaE/Pmp3 family membrane protein [Chitinophagaceae bacterium IBVUCB1]
MILIAILLPWLSFLLRGRILRGIVCLLLQITLIGWLPAAIWAVLDLQNRRAEKRHREMLATIKSR